MAHLKRPERFQTALPLILTLLLSQTACQTLPATELSAEPVLQCNKTSVETICLLQSAEQAFSEIDNDAHWISATAEFAVALAQNEREDIARKYLIEAGRKVSRLETAEARTAAAADLGKAATIANLKKIAASLLALGNKDIEGLKEDAKKYDLIGKLAVVRASLGKAEPAIETVMSFPETTDNHVTFKARSLKEIAVSQARNGLFDEAERTIEKITFGLAYYQSTVRSDVAAMAFETGDIQRAVRLLKEAEAIGRAQDNGYFVAGALRDIGVAYVDGGMRDVAMPIFEDAKAGARLANSNQEKARAMSRIGTGLADCGLFDEAKAIFSESLGYAKNAKSTAFRHFSLYEIAGSAAFAGDFDTANKLLQDLPETNFGSTSSLKAAAQRDVAWGLSKHRRMREARSLVNTIIPARERIMSFSRIVRLLKKPRMQAFPRYL